jgi:hypothetical protein
LHEYEALSVTLGRNRENGVLRRKFRPKRGEMAGDWRRLHDEEFHNLHASPNIISMITSRRMRWVVHVARRGERNFGRKT